MTPVAFAAEADTERGVSIFDANPRCMERTVDANGPGCILRSDGAPRQFYPPPEATTPVLPNPPIMPPNPSIPREAPRSSTRQGG
jgi:hypothetical protein